MKTTATISNQHRRGHHRRRPAAALLLLPMVLVVLLLAALGGMRGAGAVSLPVEGALTVTTTPLPPQPPQRRPAVAPGPPSAQEASDDPSSSFYEVLIVPHSHCDAGYKKSVEGYYLTEVKRVLDSVVAALEGDETLKFAWAEAAYLWRWWQVRVCRLGVRVCCILVVVLGREEDRQPLIGLIAPSQPHQHQHANRTPPPASGGPFGGSCGRGGWSWWLAGGSCTTRPLRGTRAKSTRCGR